jgi:Flp pilus assembly protein TadD
MFVVLAGCAARSDRGILDPAAWAATLSGRGVDPAATPDPLRYDEEMRWTALRLAGSGTQVERLRQLQDALFDENRFPFRYELEGTRTAMEAFRARDGNCLSFTSLFIAMARSLGIPVRAASPLYSVGSETQGDLIVVSTHIVAVFQDAAGLAVFDFDRRSDRQVPVAVTVLNDLRVTSLYLSNLGVRALRDGDSGRARALLESAARLAPDSPATLGNLGVARRRAGDVAGAFDAYRSALAASPNDPTVLNNLASLYRSQGCEREALAALDAADVATSSHHLLIVRADVELERGRASEAARLCRRAQRMAPRDAATWLCRARAELLGGHASRARRALAHALELAPGDEEARRLGREIETDRK